MSPGQRAFAPPPAAAGGGEPPPVVAIVSAMRDELRALLPLLQAGRSVVLGGREFHVGTVHGVPVVLVLSGIGKVAAATTATLLLDRFDVQAVVFTGVAGGLQPGVEVGDVVVAAELLQHDMDASPLFPRFEVPLTGRSRFAADPALVEALAAAARRCLGDDRRDDIVGAPERQAFGIGRPGVHLGLVISGDRFVSSQAQADALRSLLPDALAVEMEGAALAQVCADFGRPFAVIRTISDRADDSAPVDFARFLVDVAGAYTRAIVLDWLSGSAARDG